MRLIPTHCQTCSRTALAEASSITDGIAICAGCGGRARSLPGESYNAGDETLFNELSATLREAGISPVNACQLGGELEIRKYGPPGRALKKLVQILPSLGLLELIVANQPAAMRKAEGMLATLLEALASSRSQSGIMPAVQPPAGKKTSTG